MLIAKSALPVPDGAPESTYTIESFPLTKLPEAAVAVRPVIPVEVID